MCVCHMNTKAQSSLQLRVMATPVTCHNSIYSNVLQSSRRENVQRNYKNAGVRIGRSEGWVQNVKQKQTYFWTRHLNSLFQYNVTCCCKTLTHKSTVISRLLWQLSNCLFSLLPTFLWNPTWSTRVTDGLHKGRAAASRPWPAGSEVMDKMQTLAECFPTVQR